MVLPISFSWFIMYFTTTNDNWWLYVCFRTDKLETLIPKQEGGVVMVVRGSTSGQLGRVVARDKSRYLATVQLIHTEQVLTLDYDNICEYVGSVPDDEWSTRFSDNVLVKLNTHTAKTKILTLANWSLIHM